MLSPARYYWIHRMASIGQKPAPVAVRSFDMGKLLTMFKRAAVTLKRPAIVLDVDGSEVKVSLAGERSRYTGQIMVASATYGGAYYGRIDTDGKFYEGRDKSDKVVNLLCAMQDSPEKAAAEYGRLTGKCCFCNKALSDEKSTAVGYGKTCAKNFGLSWGKLKANKALALPA
jgi:hypothetical protein